MRAPAAGAAIPGPAAGAAATLEVETPIGTVVLESELGAITGLRLPVRRAGRRPAAGAATGLGSLGRGSAGPTAPVGPTGPTGPTGVGIAGDAPVPTILIEAARQLGEYFGGTRRQFDLPLLPAGTPFQLAVWEALRAIPYGATASYAEVAAMVGRPQASRAVGQANGANPIAVIVPCHRVIAANGDLGGFGGGPVIKTQLLAVEGVRLRARPGRPDADG